MELPKGTPERSEILMSMRDAEVFCGAMWRKPSKEELEEIALFFAEDLIEGNITVLGEELDAVERIIETTKQKEQEIKELEPLTMVMDLVKLDIQIFYTYFFMIDVTTKTKGLYFSDGISKLLKRNGKLESADEGNVGFKF